LRATGATEHGSTLIASFSAHRIRCRHPKFFVLRPLLSEQAR
jgi:hypothetical protein